MTELLKPLSETISNRAKNPIIRSFTAWLIHNFSAWTTLVFDNSKIWVSQAFNKSQLFG